MFCHHRYFLFCKPIFFSGNCRILRDLAFGSVKTRFKASWDIFSENLHATLDSQVTFFVDVCPRRATKLRSLQCREIRHLQPKYKKSSKFKLRLIFQKSNSSFAPASQQIIKRLNQRMKRTNTRFNHQSD